MGNYWCSSLLQSAASFDFMDQFRPISSTNNYQVIRTLSVIEGCHFSPVSVAYSTAVYFIAQLQVFERNASEDSSLSMLRFYASDFSFPNIHQTEPMTHSLSVKIISSCVILNRLLYFALWGEKYWQRPFSATEPEAQLRFVAISIIKEVWSSRWFCR